jgi:hypothetical protein
MASEETTMEVVMNFYEHKDAVKFLAEAKEKNVTVHVAAEKKDEFTDYVVGGLVHVIRFCKPGKPVAITIRACSLDA